ncbi:DUF4097 domain-containing protein [Candidatus Poribacteria bacterium]
MKKCLIIMLLPVFLYACAVVKDNVRETETESDEFSSLQLREVQVETKNGSIESSVWDDDRIYVTFEKWATGGNTQDAEDNLKDIEIHIDEDTESGTLSIEVDAPIRPGTNYGCNVSLNLPASLSLNLRSSNGAVRVSESQNNLECSTSNGSITIEDTSGYARLKTSNGKITVQNHNGELNGKTSNGAIDADIVLSENGECLLKTSNGAITLSISEETSAIVGASTSNGKIEVDDLGITLIRMEKTEFEGTMGNGDGNIELGTSNGSIHIKGRL